MSSITIVSFSILINGAASPFFHSERGIRQGCSLSPLLFLLVVEGLSRALRDAKNHGSLKGIHISQALQITHLLFVDDILIFCIGSMRDTNTLQDILELFSKATRMEINERKSTLTSHLLSAKENWPLNKVFPFSTSGIDEGLKYLGFCLKPNDYRKQDWNWLIEKLEKQLKQWSRKWLSRAWRLVLGKSVLEAIPVYWMSLDWIHKGILEAVRKFCLRFLWSGKQDS